MDREDDEPPHRAPGKKPEGSEKSDEKHEHGEYHHGHGEQHHGHEHHGHGEHHEHHHAKHGDAPHGKGHGHDHDGKDKRPGHPDDELGFELPPPAKLSKTRAIAIVCILAVVVIAAFVIGYLPKRQQREDLGTEAARTSQARPRVEVTTPKPVTIDHPSVLPGSVMPLEETTIVSRTDGYVHKWLVDIGDKVDEGTLLAEIDIPEVDQQFLQAKAQLAQAVAAVAQNKANAALSKVNLVRYVELGKQKLVADADVDQRRAQAEVDVANVNAAEANVNSMKANLDRLQQLKEFAHITAPFAGTITARTVEIGTLIVTGTTPLFKLAATDPMRVYIQVPQDVAPSVRAGIAAEVTVRELPNHPFTGHVARASGELDPVLRTMTTEVRVPNPKGELLPGMYAQVALALSSPRGLFEIPATAIYSDSHGVRVAVIDAQQKAHFVTVVIERDTGAAVEISSGLDGTEHVVRLASASLSEGTDVEIITKQAEGATGASGASGGSGAKDKEAKGKPDQGGGQPASVDKGLEPAGGAGGTGSVTPPPAPKH